MVDDYHVFATSTMYLLDAKREILLRPNSVKQVDGCVDWYLVQSNLKKAHFFTNPLNAIFAAPFACIKAGRRGYVIHLPWLCQNTLCQKKLAQLKLTQFCAKLCCA